MVSKMFEKKKPINDSLIAFGVVKSFNILRPLNLICILCGRYFIKTTVLRYLLYSQGKRIGLDTS